MSALETIRGHVESGGEPDDVLRAVVEALVDEGGCAWAGILFSEEGELILGPEAGTQSLEERSRADVVWDGARIAELVADGCDDPSLLDEVAPLLSILCLVGWDTGGVTWDP